jgi:molecular chaperone GrpE
MMTDGKKKSQKVQTTPFKSHEKGDTAKLGTSAEEEALPELVSVPLKDYAAQLKEIDDLKQQIKENLEGWQRERADFTNYRNRIERERTQQKQDLSIEIIKKYLVVLDDIQRALKNRPTEGEAGAWSEGIELIKRKLENILEMEGIQPIEVKEFFDPKFHEAISHEEYPDHESGRIIEVVQQGYILGDRVIRPAQVRVAR